ncbi:MAG: hypothetical protein JKY56_10145, partial [Kofleriaceae bacterium]|nr:hypothetical protein [Kofleriaceae bacterium]
MSSEQLLGGLSFTLPTDASAEGYRIDAILHFANVTTLILSAVIIVWLGVSLIRDRRSKSVRYTHGTTWRERAVPLAMAAIVLFVVDGYLLYKSNKDLHGSILRVDEALAEVDSVRVQIGARQWAWDVRYAGQDGRFDTDDDIYTVSELVVPIGRAIVFELGSMDVVHSFYLPNFRIKQDVIPGAVGLGWFRAKTLGRYEIACAQHCGVHHYQMRGEVVVLSISEFEEWRRSMSADSLRMKAEDSRAVKEEASRSDIGELWPDLAPCRDWAWRWQSGGG